MVEMGTGFGKWAQELEWVHVWYSYKFLEREEEVNIGTGMSCLNNRILISGCCYLMFQVFMVIIIQVMMYH